VHLRLHGHRPQSISSINFLLNEEMFKMFAGVYMIMVFDPQILFNDGFYDLMEVPHPAGTLLKPLKPAACRAGPMRWGASSTCSEDSWARAIRLHVCRRLFRQPALHVLGL